MKFCIKCYNFDRSLPYLDQGPRLPVWSGIPLCWILHKPLLIGLVVDIYRCYYLELYGLVVAE